MRILIVGLGSIAKKHIRAIGIIYPNATIIALRSGKSDNTVDNVQNIYSLEELTILPDFAIISNATVYHEKYIAELSILNIPLFIEKPALSSLKNASEIIKIITYRNLTTYVACNLRFHPCIQFLLEYSKKNIHKINEISVYCGSYLPEWRPDQNFRESYSANIEMGGGVNLDLIHEIDYTTWLFGFPNECRSYSSSKSTLGINSPDYANYLLMYKSFNISIILNYYRRDPKRTIEIVLDDSTTIIDLINCTVFNSESGLLFKDDSFNLIDTYKLQLEYFIGKISNNSIPMNNLEESIKVLKIAI